MAGTIVLAAMILAPGVTASLQTLHPGNWQNTVIGRDYLVFFTVQGCKHCEKLAPMMEYVAQSAPELRVGRVDATAHNGLARSFGVKRFPSIVRFDAQSIVYEYTANARTPPQIIAFARGDHRYGSAGTVAPEELLDNVPEWWLMLEALWPPFRTAITWALGIALGIKGLAVGCLKLLKRGDKARSRGAKDEDGRSQESNSDEMGKSGKQE